MDRIRNIVSGERINGQMSTLCLVQVWNVHSVLNVLHSLVDKSNINKQLEVYNSGGNPDQVGIGRLGA